MEPIVWMVCGVTTVAAAAMAPRSGRARIVGRWALGVLFVLGGAVVNSVYLLTGTDYGGFADAAFLPWVTDAWQAVVAPRQGLFIGLLVAFEAIVGLLVVLGGRRTQVGLVGILGFHVGLLAFGWWFWVWAVPMLVAVGALLHAELAAGRAPAAPRAPLGRRPQLVR